MSNLVSTFEKFSQFLGKTSIKKIPGIKRVYRLFKELLWLWPSKSVIEIEGSKIYLNVHEKNPSMRKTFRVYASRRIHEKSTTELFKKIVKEGNVVLDIGANIGYFTLLAAKLVGKKGKVYSFEPEPRNYNYLLKNIELNSYSNVIAIQKAVSDKLDKIKLYICPYDTGHHTINQYDGIIAYNPHFRVTKKDFVEIETIPIDEFFQNMKQSIDVVKMDVEGAEMLTLSGMDGVIKENANLKMFIEFFPLLIRKMGCSPEEFINKLLRNYQFSMFVISDDYNATKEKSIKINNANELMNLCKGELDHVNLFLEKGDKMFEGLFFT